ncbi:LAME_0D06018g1_1 [Lachancea meyersii CBS 8951]|uniref:Regulator of rDNA transcription 14 n=1 Tax=Lachancea meyersii CBS 8951 TaxID=1266667 RepID=A0A1G4J9E6_9SACH|nr:LAME_0D06018g1_1 [Lachancea meyersii CBS 8951]
MNKVSSRNQATAVVNNVLSQILPGCAKIDGNTSRPSRSKRASKGSKAQLISQNLKNAARVREQDAHGIKKKELKKRKKQIKAKLAHEDKMDQNAKLQILQKHQEQGTLTQKERKFLNKVIGRNVRDLKSWDMEGEETLSELQESILDSRSKQGSARSKKGRKDFREAQSSKAQTSDHRYAGLTPGLAPVGLSDEEESDGE